MHYSAHNVQSVSNNALLADRRPAGNRSRLSQSTARDGTSKPRQVLGLGRCSRCIAIKYKKKQSMHNNVLEPTMPRTRRCSIAHTDDLYYEFEEVCIPV